jgi:hypothetical protein
MTSLTSLALVAVVFSADVAEQPKLAVLPLQVEQSAQADVPDLADDYLLAAVQNSGGYQVIGPDDVSALIGFEEQKDLLGCDEASCFADLGGALGVELLAVFKVARLDTDWVVTAKLINTAETRVTARASHFLAGGTKELLQGMPTVVAKLFGKKLPPAAGSPAPQPAPSYAAAMPPATPPPAVTGTLERLRPKDRRRWERYLARAKDPLGIDAWVASKNKESTGMFVAEMVALGGIVIIPVIGGTTGESLVLPALWGMSLLALPILLIVDAFDPGEVNLLPARPVAADALPPPDETRRVTSLQLAFSF